MGTNRTLKPVLTCANCGGPMPSPRGRGRPAVYCTGACRKAAHEARRTGKPDAFEVKIVERTIVEEHDLTECVARVTSSPAACRRVLHELARLAAEGTLKTDPKWDSTLTAANGLMDAIHVPHRVRPRRW